MSLPKVGKRKKRKKPVRHVGPCFVKGCTANGGIMHHCITCEELGKKEPYTVQCCDDHAQRGFDKLRKHAITKHPVNLLRVTIAGLKGEDIT